MRDTGNKTGFSTFKATGGAAVVLDARDGSVVALASAPTFDVTKFTDGIPAEEFKTLNNPKSNYPLLDRALQGQYAPGSTWKLFTSIAALEAGTTTPDEVIYDRGFVLFGEKGKEQEFKNAGKEPHFNVTLPSALTVSSDVYFYTQGFRLWYLFNGQNGKAPDKKKGYAIQRVAKEFGFGKPTAIGLANEQVGRIPDREVQGAPEQGQPGAVVEGLAPG